MQARSENLRFVFQPAKGVRVNDAVTIALEVVSVRMGELRISAALRELDGKPEAG